MAKLQPADDWAVNAEHLSVVLYSRLLRVVAGIEPASKDQAPTTKFQFLLPFFVLGGMAGMRTCELVRSNPGNPVLNWEDILWAKNLIVVRHEVAKQRDPEITSDTFRRSRKPLRFLRPLAQEGPVITCCDNHLYIERQELAHHMKIKLPEKAILRADPGTWRRARVVSDKTLNTR
jgi:hypothetical protein